MKIVACLSFAFILFFFNKDVSAQSAPAIQWQKCLGGSGNEAFSRIVRATDGGYVVASITHSNDGDVIPHTGTSNIWLVKFSNTGSIVWQKCFANGAPGAGSGFGNCIDLKNTPDGGYIIASATFFNDAAYTGYHAQVDALIIKLRGDGTTEWQKCYGGSLNDWASSIQPTRDGGYIFLGQTASSTLTSTNGDVSGNHGGEDLWVVKINQVGTIQWQKCVGGEKDDFISGKSYSSGGSIKQTNDNGYILFGSTFSSQGDVSGFHSGVYQDAWVVKLDSSGNNLWQRCLGGSNTDYGNDIIQLADGNYLAVATALSWDGDVINNHSIGSSYNSDIWVIKLNNQGAIIWQKCLGGSSNEYPYRIKQALDGNFIIAGQASSFNGDVSGIHNPPGIIGSGTDAWLVKINTAGDILWQKAFGGTNTDGITDFCLTDDGEVVFTAYTQSGSDGDIVGSHNSLSVQNTVTDVWVVKTGGLNTIKGSVFIDYNGNGVKDANDTWLKSALVKSEKPGYSWQTFVNNGSFINKVDSGTFTTSLVLPKPYYTIVPVSKQSTFSTFFNTDSIGFSLLPIQGKKDYRVSLLPLTPARRGFYSNYKIKFENAGTDTLINKTVQLIKDSRCSFQYSMPVPTAVSGDTLKWNIANLLPSDSGSITVTFLNSSSVFHIDDTIKYIASIDTTGDLATSDNIFLLRQRITSAYDPNDKQESYGGFITPEDVAANKDLTYTIRFQNTGNDTAFNIIIRDTLDVKTNGNTIQMVDASHSYQFNIRDGKYCTWVFDNIQLVDSIQNEPLSHGYLTYRIKPISTLVTGDIIRNSASIYFDFNPAVQTNTQLTIVKGPLPVRPQVTGLQVSYCNSLNTQKAVISNLPLASSGTTVSVQLDATVLSVAADSSFSFDVSTLTAASHTVIVTFTNASGAVSDTSGFTVTAAVTPDVNVSASITNIVNTTTPVTVTASNATGGGGSPLYTFGKDRSFTNILQAEGSSSQYAVNITSLPMGDSWIYVRMKTSASCYTIQANIDSIKLYKLLAPVQPVITGLAGSYCGNQGVIKVKISNPPAAEYLATVSVLLDYSTALTIAADSTVSVNPSALTAGTHSVKTTYTNASGFKADTTYFIITQAATPDVNVSTNITTVVNLTDNVIVTASSAAGGGSSPLYTFAKDKAMTNVLQAESGTNTLTITPGTLAVGANWIYVRMKTSSSCYTVQTNTDSIKIDRSSITGLVDIDNPGQVITVYPNPFKQGISISGLSTAKTYLITISDANGKEVFRQQVSNSSNFTGNKNQFLNGSYWLRIYDVKKKRLIGTSLLIKE